MVFIPLFVAIDPLGMVPVFLGVTGRLTPRRRRQVTLEAVGAALIISVAFMLAGQLIFDFLGIHPADFRIAGGILLLVLAVYDLLITGKPGVDEDQAVGIVPLATPLIAGPATLTAVLVLSTDFGYVATGVSILVNFALLLIAMLSADFLARWIGQNAMRGLSKLVMILLAAFAVYFIRTGVLEVMEMAREGT
jgi:multiple antibiotic resistance protein